ncbi:hypothetical protein RB195_009509 [Necator americanus]|uniref:Uncharacterized protein n=1 Tax=Necator americanus TaxID=51031 RepID=A0ABR1CTM5_NECAM
MDCVGKLEAFVTVDPKEEAYKSVESDSCSDIVEEVCDYGCPGRSHEDHTYCRPAETAPDSVQWNQSRDEVTPRDVEKSLKPPFVYVRNDRTWKFQKETVVATCGEDGVHRALSREWSTLRNGSIIGNIGANERRLLLRTKWIVPHVQGATCVSSCHSVTSKTELHMLYLKIPICCRCLGSVVLCVSNIPSLNSQLVVAFCPTEEFKASLHEYGLTNRPTNSAGSHNTRINY